MKSYLASDMKILNRKSVYDYISNPECSYFSRSQIGKASNISNPTILKIISCFIDKELIFEIGESETVSVGRKPHMLCFNPNSAFAIGASYDGKYLDVGIINLSFHLLDQTRIQTQDSIYTILNTILPQQVEKLLNSQYVKKGKILGLGIALPAIIDEKTCQIIGSAPLVGIKKPTDLRPLLNALENQLSIPIFVENDVNAAALGEYRSSRVCAYHDIVLITLGSGCGAGIILDGKLRRGETSMSGEIGYLVFDKKYVTRPDALGYLEKMLNPEYYISYFNYDIYSDHPDCAKLPLLLEHISTQLSLAIANLSICLGVNHFVLGGFLFEQFRAPLLEAVNRKCKQYCLGSMSVTPQKNLKASAIGSGSIVIENTILDFLDD